MHDVSNDHLSEQAYLIDRGVRPMALLGSYRLDATEKLAIATRLEAVSAQWSNAIPFVIDSGAGLTHCGFAAFRWVVGTFEWAVGIQEPYKSRVIGLLLGYSPLAIMSFEEMSSIRGF